ncbi:MAG: hypothetical protein M0Q21_03850 [Ignavibacteriaceae bacterium]|nr:hypothetical protein [Ignavibacteriaceae bacterium]
MIHILSRMLLFFVILLMGCKNNSSQSPDLNTYTDKSYGGIRLTNEKMLVVRNATGLVNIQGAASTDTLIWYLFKSVQAETKVKGDEKFAFLQLSTQAVGDTLFVDVYSTVHESNLICGVTLTVPSGVICKIEEAVGNVNVSDLDSVLTVGNAPIVDLKRHSGSCQISGGTGNNSLELSLPENGYCRVKINNGNILLKIPVSVSASVYAKSLNGVVSQKGLTIAVDEQSSGFLSGKLGLGNGEIRLETSQGNIQIENL